MSKLTNSKNIYTIKEINILFIILIFLNPFLLQISSTKWNFNKGGEDWPNSCKNGDQGGIDISGPFEYKSK
jgi:hypothetical protein